MIQHKTWYRIWKRKALGCSYLETYAYQPREGWFLIGFIPLYVRDTGPKVDAITGRIKP